jgi:hypothetical protein
MFGIGSVISAGGWLPLLRRVSELQLGHVALKLCTADELADSNQRRSLKRIGTPPDMTKLIALAVKYESHILGLLPEKPARWPRSDWGNAK